MTTPRLDVTVDADTAGFDNAMREITESTKAFGRIFTGTLKQAAVSGKSFEDVLRSMGQRLASFALNQAFKPLENLFGSFFSSFAGSILPNAKGNAFGANGVVPFAKGGVVAAPSYFPFAGGTGLMGEKGPEAIMPLARGPDGRLGVQGASTSQPANIIFNVQATDAASFRKSEAQISTMLARAAARGQRGL